ncbi:MAG: adenylate kinase family protein [Candidatus Syntropharchaeia archaeon]
MKIALTGTPGTGKTSACRFLSYNTLDINRLVEEKGFYKGFDEKRNCIIADIEKIKEYVRNLKENVIMEGHFSHLLDPDMVIVLRTDPFVLKKRLEEKGFDKKKILENMEAEAIDVILIESLEECDEVYEIDTTEKSVEEVARCIEKIIEEKKGKKPGSIDWTGRIEEIIKLHQQ